MLTIRLTRIGKKNMPMYRLAIAEKHKDPYGDALEILGSYNPFTKELNCQADRIKHWLSVGAGMSPTVNNLLIEKKIIEGKKVKASKDSKKKKGDAESAPSPAAVKEVPKEVNKVEEKPAEIKETPKEEAKMEEKAEEKPAETKATPKEEAKMEEKKEEIE